MMQLTNKHSLCPVSERLNFSVCFPLVIDPSNSTQCIVLCEQSEYNPVSAESANIRSQLRSKTPAPKTGDQINPASYLGNKFSNLLVEILNIIVISSNKLMH